MRKELNCPPKRNVRSRSGARAAASAALLAAQGELLIEGVHCAILAHFWWLSACYVSQNPARASCLGEGDVFLPSAVAPSFSGKWSRRSRWARRKAVAVGSTDRTVVLDVQLKPRIGFPTRARCRS